MRVTTSDIRTVDLDRLVAALRRWYEQTGRAEPNRLLAELVETRRRAEQANQDGDLLARALLLLKVQRRGGVLEVPDPDDDVPVPLAQQRAFIPTGRHYGAARFR